MSSPKFQPEHDMRVTKRDGSTENVSFDKILTRIKKLGTTANIQSINYTNLAIKVIDQLYDSIPTTKIDELTAEQCATMSIQHPDYGVLASYVIISNNHKNIGSSFYNAMNTLYSFVDVKGKHTPIISHSVWTFIEDNYKAIESLIDHRRDYTIDYFGFKTLERSYLLRVHGQIVERPQHMWMRVAIGIHLERTDTLTASEKLEYISRTYDAMSLKYFTHATPTLYNAGTPRPQLSSCYLIAMEKDSIEGIFDTLKDCAKISKHAGGIGLHIHNIRATGSLIRGTNGLSNGIVPMLRVFNNTARYIDQGGRRNGSFAIYLEPWHVDIEDFLEMKKNHGDEEMKGRDLFYALWIPDLFMEKVKASADWCLFCPDESPGLCDIYGDEFRELYNKYEEMGQYRKKVKARDLWLKILDSQMETGTPYMLYKDAINRKTNQKNLGTIKSSNLCVAPETLVLTDKGHVSIQELYNMSHETSATGPAKQVSVWNGNTFSDVHIEKTGENQKVIEVTTSDGCVIECTPYHRFYVQTGYCKCEKDLANNITIVEAANLKKGDKLIKCNYPVIDGKTEFKYAYTHGFFCGDGIYLDAERLKPGSQKEIETMQKAVMILGGEKMELEPHLEYVERRDTLLLSHNNKTMLILPDDLPPKYAVPPGNASIGDKVNWLSGLADADGSISLNETNQQLQISSINREFLIQIKYMLQTCGVNPKVTLARDAKTRVKNSVTYTSSKSYRLLIASGELEILKDYGFAPKHLKLTTYIPSRVAKRFITIEQVEDKGRITDTYCFTEPKRHMGIFNGVITGQCSEIAEYSDENETAVCNLASIALNKFVNTETREFDYVKLHEITKVITDNLNQVIDVNYYPTTKTKVSNMRHRPIGIGVQGLADVFMIMDIPFHSDAALTINRYIFETIYHAALEASNEISRARYEDYIQNTTRGQRGSKYTEEEIANVGKVEETLIGAYSSFVGSPASKGELQFDLWEKYKGSSSNTSSTIKHSGMYDWDKLKASIVKYGLRNSLLLAPMPTASTSQILGNNECFEPITSNIYTRRTLAGEFIMVNKYLMKELIEMGLWSENVKNAIIANKGSVQHIAGLTEHMKNKYKTVWEIPMKHVIDMAADRGVYICQTQSMNLWVEEPNYNTLTSMHFYSWGKGLKTGMYYLRRKAKHQAQQFTIEPEKKRGGGVAELEKEKEEDGICEYCSA
jgi:ribonucleoside-diphosphate reductase alpha chain